MARRLGRESGCHFGPEFIAGDPIGSPRTTEEWLVHRQPNRLIWRGSLYESLSRTGISRLKDSLWRPKDLP
jgi:hypothetical protein